MPDRDLGRLNGVVCRGQCGRSGCSAAWAFRALRMISGLPRSGSLTIDIVFKMVFADPKMAPALAALLTAILRPPSPITSVEVLNPEIPRRIADDKVAMLDLLVLLEDGTRVNVEMQLTDPGRTWLRAPFYWARVHSDQAARGQDHLDLKRTIVIFIVNFVQFKHLTGQAHHIFELRHRDDPDLRHPHIRIDFVELPKLPLTLPEDAGLPACHQLAIWGKILRDPADKSLEGVCMSDQVIKATKDKLTEISRDVKNRERARWREKNRIAKGDYEALKKAALEDARAEVQAEGRAEGEAKVINKVLHGILTAEATSGLSDDVIANLVGVSVDVVTAARRRLSARS